MAEKLKEPRTYGGWRRKRGLGFFGLSQAETGIAFVIGGIAVFTLGWARSIFLPVLGISVFAGFMLARIEGIPLWSHIHRELSLLISKASGQGMYVSSLAISADGNSGDSLPGSLAPTQIFEIAIPGGKSAKYGVVWNQALKTATVVWKAHPHTPHLADAHQVDAWVSSWHQFLASLGYICLLYTSPSPRDKRQSRMPSSA